MGRLELGLNGPAQPFDSLFTRLCHFGEAQVSRRFEGLSPYDFAVRRAGSRQVSLFRFGRHVFPCQVVERFAEQQCHARRE